VIREWGTFRTRFQGAMPGRELAVMARSLGPEFTLDPNARRYVAGRVGRSNPNGLYLLREWYAMARSHAGTDELAAGTEAVREMFNLEPLPVSHHYTISSGLSEILVTQAVVDYRNDLGMRYSSILEMRGVSYGRGYGVRGRLHGSPDPQPLTLWLPSDFRSYGLVTVTGPGLVIVNQLRFTGHGGLVFMLDTGAYATGPGASETGGTVLTRDVLNVRAQAVPPQAVLRGADTTRLLDAYLLFETGSAAMSGASNDTLEWIVSTVGQFLATYADSRLEVSIRGHASPRWRSAGSASESDRQNLHLSEERTNAARQQLENAINAHASAGRCDFRVDPCPPTAEPGPEPEMWSSGSSEARASGVTRGEDTAVDRRVDIAVDRSEYGYNPERAQPRPGEAPDPHQREGLAEADLTGTARVLSIA
jgi:hypothetical protein